MTSQEMPEQKVETIDSTNEQRLISEYVEKKSAKLASEIDGKLSGAPEEQKAMREAILQVERKNGLMGGTVDRYLRNTRNFEEFEKAKFSHIADLKNIPTPETLSVFESGGEVFIFANYDPNYAMFSLNVADGNLKRISGSSDNIAILCGKKIITLNSGSIATLRGSTFVDDADGWQDNEKEGAANRTKSLLESNGFTQSGTSGDKSDILHPRYLASESLYYSRPLAERKRYQEALKQKGEKVTEEPGVEAKAMMMMRDLLSEDSTPKVGLDKFCEELTKKIRDYKGKNLDEDLSRILEDLNVDLATRYLDIPLSYLSNLRFLFGIRMLEPVKKAFKTMKNRELFFQDDPKKLRDELKREFKFFNKDLVKQLEAMGF